MHNSQNSLSNLKFDIMGGLTAAIIALPLALAFGVSSGAGAVAGLYGAICVGLFAALFGGTPTQVVASSSGFFKIGKVYHHGTLPSNLWIHDGYWHDHYFVTNSASFGLSGTERRY